MISKEQAVIIRSLASFLNNTAVDVDADLDFEVLMQFAKSQEIEGIIYYTIAKSNASLQSEIAPLQSKYLYSVFVYKNRMSVLKRIEADFTKAKIPYFIFKGSEIAGLYSVPALRTMGDSDILVHTQDMEKADFVLKKCGFVLTQSGPNEWIYDYKGMEFELHHRLMNEDEIGATDCHKRFMNRHWNYAVSVSDSFQYHLDCSYHFVFLIMHLRKHLINSGVGFRQFMDLSVMVKECELDWDFIQTELEKMELLEFAEVCLSLCGKWFGVSSPLASEIDDSFAEETVINIFEGGVFGFSDAENADNYRALQIYNGGNTMFSRVKLMLRILFPSYRVMRAIPHYSFIDGKPYLLPIAWMRRFIHSVFSGKTTESYNNASKSLNISKDKVDSRIEYLNKWKI